MNKVIRPGSTNLPGTIQLKLMVGESGGSGSVGMPVTNKEALLLLSRPFKTWLRDGDHFPHKWTEEQKDDIIDRCLGAASSCQVFDDNERVSPYDCEWKGVGFDVEGPMWSLRVDSDENVAVLEMDMSATDSKAAAACDEIARIAQEAIQ